MGAPKTGKCRRYAPTASGSRFADFPLVKRVDWCGEFRNQARARAPKEA